MKSLAQLLLYPYRVCVLPKSDIDNIDASSMIVPVDILTRLKLSDELIEVPSKECKNKTTAAKWLLAEAVVYNNVTCSYIKEDTVYYITESKGKQSFSIKPSNQNKEYFDLLRCSYLIRWGARLQDFPGDYIKIIESDLSEHLTTPYSCDCIEFQKLRSCTHIPLVTLFLQNRKDLSFLSIV
jgi:hypothetical protein